MSFPISGPFLLKQGATLPALPFAFTTDGKPQSPPLDLTGKLISFRMRSIEAAVLAIPNGQVTVNQPPGLGTGIYPWQSGDTALAGRYYGEWVLQGDSGGRSTGNVSTFVNAFTDATRLAHGGVLDDGLRPVSGVGVWQAATNLMDNSCAFNDALGANNFSNVSITRDLTEAFLTATCFKATGTANAAMQAAFMTRAGTFFPVTAGNAYAAQAWVKPGFTGLFTAFIFWYTAGSVFISSSSGFTSPLGAGVAFTPLYVTGIAPATATQALIVVSTNSTLIGQFMYLAGVQFEAGAVPTPPLLTTTAAVTRTATHLQMPSSVFGTISSGGMSARLTMGYFSNGVITTSTVFSLYIGATDYLDVSYSPATSNWYIESRSATSGSTTCTVAAPAFYIGGEDVTVTAFWTPAQIGISLNGSPFAVIPRGNLPVGANPTLADIGGLTTATQVFNGRIRWIDGMIGTPSAADAAVFAARPDIPTRSLYLQDDFQRADTAAGSLGTLVAPDVPAGLTYSVSESWLFPATNAKITSHRFVMPQSASVNVSAEALLVAPATPVRMTAKFSFAPGLGTGPCSMVMVMSNTPMAVAGLPFKNAAFHFGCGHTVWDCDVYVNSAGPFSIGSGTFTVPLDTTGTKVYQIGVVLDAANNQVHLELPDGEYVTLTDFRIPLGAGPYVAWEIFETPTSVLGRFEEFTLELPQALAMPAGSAGDAAQWNALNSNFSQTVFSEDIRPVGDYEHITVTPELP